MRVLFDIVHPADVLFFRRPIDRLKSGGAEVAIASRRKDVTTDLLDGCGLRHEAISSVGSGAWRLAGELVCRDLAMFHMARQFRPHVMAGFGGIAISHVGRMLGIPSISFYDTDHAALQLRMTLPFISEWHVPWCWRGPKATGRTHYFKGIKELSYFHPDEFKPNPDIARRHGWEPGRDVFFLRFVSWQAAHDLNRKGHGTDELFRLVEILKQRGRVVLSAEGSLPADLEQHRFQGDPFEAHHLLAHCRLCMGESSTMAAEAAMLGVPAILTVDFHASYVDALIENGVIKIETNLGQPLIDAIDAVLACPKEEWLARRDAFLADKCNMVDYVVDRLRAHDPLATHEKTKA